ncbi:MAG: hypothetical protein KGN35_02500 [Betaproteobacteria bacterium]|nr:hypothetical protein [Betaproteobacteria bacterium]
MLWLPLQSATAAILSVCVQEKNSNRHVEKSAVTIDNHHHEGCQKQAADNGHHVLTSLPCDDTSCDAYGNTPIPPGQIVLTLPIPARAIPSLNSGFVSFVPEQPQHPPLLISL